MAIPSDLPDVPGGIGSNSAIQLNKEAVANVPDSNTNVDALKREHPEYTVNSPLWRKYSDCYDAENIYRYIFQHSRESNDIFEKRVKRGYYYNYLAAVVDLFVSYMYHAPITRNHKTDEIKDLDDFYRDADLCGSSFHQVIQMASTFAQLHGHVGVLVDMPKPDEQIKSEEDRKKKGHRPYLCLVQALQIKDWELDEYAKFKWVKIETTPESERSWKSSPDSSTRKFIIWTRETWEEWILETSEVEGEGGREVARLVDSGANDLKRVPLVIVRNERKISHRWMGLSAVRDIADINIAILNWSSLGDEEIYERCINVLCLERDNTDENIRLSHQNVLEYEVGTNPPQYLTPGTSPLELIAGWIERAKDEIYRLAKLGGSNGVAGTREATSGIAYAFEFNETNQSLARKAESLEQGEKEIFTLLASWYKKEWTGEVSYPREFGVEDFLSDLQMITSAKGALSSETALKELEIKVCNKLFSQSDQKLRDTIKEEIESSDPRESLIPPMPPADSARSTGQTTEKKGSASGGNSEKKKGEKK